MSTTIAILPSSLLSVFTARPEIRTRMRDFFSSHIRNPNTRRAYLEAVRQYLILLVLKLTLWRMAQRHHHEHSASDR
jgi:hypothetical protein